MFMAKAISLYFIFAPGLKARAIQPNANPKHAAPTELR